MSLQKKICQYLPPSLAASKLESSKSWAKDFMIRHKIPTAEYGVFEDAASAINFAKNLDYHVAVKAPKRMEHYLQILHLHTKIQQMHYPPIASHPRSLPLFDRVPSHIAINDASGPVMHRSTTMR